MPWAANLGLPPTICGPHFHSWEHNRDYVRRRERWSFHAATYFPFKSADLNRGSRGKDKMNLILTRNNEASMFRKSLCEYDDLRRHPKGDGEF